MLGSLAPGPVPRLLYGVELRALLRIGGEHRIRGEPQGPSQEPLLWGLQIPQLEGKGGTPWSWRLPQL